MKKLFIFIIVLTLVGCVKNSSNNSNISVDPTLHEQGLLIKTARFNGHDFVYIKRIMDESGDWQHDPVCLLHDLDSLMNKNKVNNEHNEYKE